MTASRPHALSQAQRNARDYRLSCMADEIDHGADAFDLKSRGYTDEDIKAVFARIDAAKEAAFNELPEVKI